MPKSYLSPFAFGRSHKTRSQKKSKRRRPTGISRRQKRQLQFETLEDRRVMSANPITAGLSASDVILRDIMLDDQTIISAFERVSDLSQYSQEELLATAEWVVLADEVTDITQLADDVGFNVVKETGILPGSFIVTPGDNADAFISSLTGSEAVDYFYPLLSYATVSTALPNDPLLKDQWHLLNFGQQVGGPGFQFIRGVPGEDINVQGAWDQGVTGKGVQIAIVDDGVFLDHPDLEANIREDLAIDVYGGGDGGPTQGAGHGTAVAGLAAGVGNNGIGITGVAYEADIVPIRLLGNNSGGQSLTNDAQIAQALLHQFNEIDVYNHSWGLVSATSRTIIDFGPLSLTALRNSVFFGRNGLGAIHVWAAGNDGAASTSSQYDGLVNSRYTIGVTVVDHDGQPANVDGTSTTYPEGGANILIAAPSASNSLTIIRDTQLGSGITTTDLPENLGFNTGPDAIGLELDNDFLFDANVEGNLLDYTSRFSGTSAAAPLVSGTIALMLEVNPDLTYRDVQHILVRTARQAVPTSNAWITNVREFQLDPLDPLTQGMIGPFVGGSWIGNPFLIQRLPNQFTNGAGFTVNQSTGSFSDAGLGHGVIDATAAVNMARRWETVGPQQSELTWTTGSTQSGTIWGREISSDETGRRLIPGGITGDGDPDKGFPDFYNQFGDDTPFTDDMGVADDPQPVSDRDIGSSGLGHPGIPITGMPSMAVEWVEVELNLTPSDVNDLDFLRITLVSPDGTNSELNVFGQNVSNGTDHLDGINSFGDAAGDLGTTNLILTTNRHWGERTEAKPRVDAAGDPITSFPLGGMPGADVIDGWRLVFENYGDSDIDINNYNVTFHGVGTAGTSRIQGALGVDLNADGFFSDDALAPGNNYSRFVIDPITGDRVSNPSQEPFAGGVIVYADINQDGTRDSTEPFFETGADGNYYFDLPPATYDIRIDDTALPEGLNNAANVQTGPITTVTIAAVGNRLTPEQMPQIADVVALNAFLIPDAPVVANTFSLSGVVFADLNGDGVQDGDDGVVADAELFLDINQNGVFDPLVDPETTTASDGTYTLTTNPILPAIPGFYSIFVVDGTTGAFGVATNPTDGEQATFAMLGDAITGVDFGFAPAIIDDPSNPDPDPDPNDPPVDPATPGAIAGVVFVDANGSGAREGEGGAAGVTVYIDANGNESFDVGELSRTTNSNGSYIFDSLLTATYVVRIEKPAAFSQTAPAASSHTVLLQPGQVAIARDFGIRSLAIDDWGDLPAAYNLTLAADDGAHHRIGSTFFLGTVDGELDGQESAGADGDDSATFDDEDGIVFAALSDISTTLNITATANSHGGYLRGWMDFNGDFVFSDDEAVVFEAGPGDFLETDGKVRRKLLDAGANSYTIIVPTDLLAANTTGVVNARFRYGEFDIVAPTGFAFLGEVEDYSLPITITNLGLQASNGPDFDNDGDVDGFDFLSWQLGFGQTTPAALTAGDADNSNTVDQVDLAIWQADYGNSGNLAALTSGGGDSSSAALAAEEPAPAAVNLPIFLTPAAVPPVVDSQQVAGSALARSFVASPSAPIPLAVNVEELAVVQEAVVQEAANPRLNSLLTGLTLETRIDSSVALAPLFGDESASEEKETAASNDLRDQLFTDFSPLVGDRDSQDLAAIVEDAEELELTLEDQVFLDLLGAV